MSIEEKIRLEADRARLATLVYFNRSLEGLHLIASSDDLEYQVEKSESARHYNTIATVTSKILISSDFSFQVPKAVLDEALEDDDDMFPMIN